MDVNNPHVLVGRFGGVREWFTPIRHGRSDGGMGLSVVNATVTALPMTSDEKMYSKMPAGIASPPSQMHQARVIRTKSQPLNSVNHSCQFRAVDLEERIMVSITIADMTMTGSVPVGSATVRS